MQQNVDNSSPEEVRGGQTPPVDNARPEDAVQPARQRSPLSTQHRQRLSNQLIGSDDDSGGPGYDTDDSAIRDYMANVAEQDQGCVHLIHSTVHLL